MNYSYAEHDKAFCRATEYLIAVRALAETVGPDLILSELLERLDGDVMKMAQEYNKLLRAKGG